MNNDPYFSRPEVSNSDLSELKKYFQPPSQVIDLEEAYRFGTLVDALITEEEKVDIYNRTLYDYIYSQEEIDTAHAMTQAFHRDEECRLLHSLATKQEVIINPSFEIQYGNFNFSLPVRCKLDLPTADIIGEIKSTKCTTQAAFESSIRYFEYDRQSAWYMDIKKVSRLVIIGISKIYPHKIFKVYITKQSPWYITGLANYQEIAFKYWSLYSNWNTMTRVRANETGEDPSKAEIELSWKPEHSNQ